MVKGGSLILINMENKDLFINEPLKTCLVKFSGAEGTTIDNRVNSLLKPFETLAKKLFYGGYIRVRNEYAIFITSVEFYYHEEEGIVKDPIVYHRNGMFMERGEDKKLHETEVPYFPIMTFNAHVSGIDITFENEALKYRASALIREYVVYDIKQGAFIKLDTRDKKSKPIPEEDIKSFVGVIDYDVPRTDSRSSYLYYFLNGFTAYGTEPNIQWVDNPNAEYGDVSNVEEGRVNASDHNWAYQSSRNLDYINQVVHSIEFLK